MTNNLTIFDHIYDDLARWLVDINQHEVVSLVNLIEQAKAYLIAAESIPEEQVQQFTDNLRYDLADFYHYYQQQADNSIYLGLLNETWWAELALMTDKTQVEWSELLDDFQHQGHYYAGDYIGFGVLVCQQCQYQYPIYHFSQVIKCPECGADHFMRQPLAP